MLLTKIISYTGDIAKQGKWKSLLLKQSGQKSSKSKRCQKFSKTIMHVTNTQINLYIAERLRRLQQVYSIYRQIYKDYANLIILKQFLRKLNNTPKLKKLCFGLGACIFSWKEDGITDEDMLKETEEWDFVRNILLYGGKRNDLVSLYDNDGHYKMPEVWRNVIDEGNLKAWTAPYLDTDYQQYKLYGRFDDITANTFFQVQVDVDYRKKWDSKVVEMNVIDENKRNNQLVVQWVSYFPFPMKPREYICLRKTKIDENKKIMIIFSKAVSHPKCPIQPNYVRVTRYQSCIIIKPHFSFDEPGFDYYLVYHDDPQVMLPTEKLTWALAKGVSDYVNNLHSAAKELELMKSRTAKNLNVNHKYEGQTILQSH